MRQVVSSENGTASLADKDGYYVGGKTGTAESYGDKKIGLIHLFLYFLQMSQNMLLFVMLENPKINKNLVYDYRGIKTKAPYNTSGWNLFMLQAK